METAYKIRQAIDEAKSNLEAEAIINSMFTRKQVLALMERVKEVSIQATLDHLHKSVTASIVYTDHYDYSRGVEGAEVDYFAETSEELISEIGASSIDTESIINEEVGE